MLQKLLGILKQTIWPTVCNSFAIHLMKNVGFNAFEKILSEVGFEPTPTFVDQNTQPDLQVGRYTLSLAP